MNQAKTKRPFNGDRNANKTPRHSGPKVKVVELRAKEAHRDTLVELTIESLKRFYKTVDALRLGNYKTGFNTYQYGLVIVDGFTVHRTDDSGFTKVTGTLFGLVKAEDFIRIANSKSEPGLSDYEQALFIEDNGGIFVDGADTKVTITKFRTNGPSNKTAVPYRSVEQFSAIMIESLFALDILPQFRKELSTVVAKQEAKNVGAPQEDIRPRPDKLPKAQGRGERTEQRRPPRKTAEPMRAQA